MKTSLTARHFNMSDNVHDHAMVSMENLAKYFEHIVDVQMVLSKEKEHWEAEIIVGVPGTTLNAESQEDILFSAIDDAIAKAERQLKKYKSKYLHEKDMRAARQQGNPLKQHR